MGVSPTFGRRAEPRAHTCVSRFNGNRHAANESRASRTFLQPETLMNTLVSLTPLAAIGWSLLYMIFGGGLLGAVVIFVIAKLFGK